MNEICKSKIKIDYSNNNNFVLETLRGKINLKFENTYLNNCDTNFIQEINKNIPCPYLIIDINDFYNKTFGLYLGAGINLFNHDYHKLEKYFKEEKLKENYTNLIKDIKDNKNININESFLIKYEEPFSEIEKFNSLMIKYIMNNFVIKAKNNQQYNTFFINSIASIYIQQVITEGELESYLKTNPYDVAFMIEHLFEIFPYTRLIQSKLYNLYDENFKYNFRYNYNHVFIVVEKNIFLQHDLSNIYQLINSFYYILNFNNNRISILISNNNNYTYIINYKKDRDNLEELLKFENKSEVFVNLTNIYTNINQKFEENKKDYFENKIAILILNYEANISENKNELIEKYKNDFSIQTIPVINIANTNNKNKNDIFKYNIFYNFTENINVQNILLSIHNMHINIDLTSKEEIKLSNIKLNDIETPLYFEVNINTNNSEKNNLSEYYEISLELYKPSPYNIFISNTDPYPNARYHLNNFMKFENELNPKIRIKAEDVKNIFYIGIEGNINFNLTLTKKIYEGNINYLILSEGEYDNIKYNISLDNKNNKFTFGEDYNVKSSIFINDTKENVMKYFTRGIELDNTEDYSFMNYNLFIFLYGKNLVNRIYKDNDDIYYFGNNLPLKDYTPFKLKREGFNRFTINKLYPFLNASCFLGDVAPSIYFDDLEIKRILNITFIAYTKELSSKITFYKNTISFKDQTPTMKFILFSLFFSHHDDTSYFKAIINLSSKNPEYSGIINFLKEKGDDNTFIMNYIKQIEQEDKSEKIMTSIIMGKSLLLSNIGLNFINEYYNMMSKSKTKISISIYDTLNQKIKNIIPFSSINNNQKVEEIIKSYQEQRDNYNNTQEMDFEIINKFGYDQFKHYDNGIKKKLLILCDENLKEGNYIINNKLKVPEEIEDINSINLTQNIFDLILLTSKNFEKGVIPDLFKIKKYNYSIYENYFHVSNLINTEKYMNDLNRVIKGSPIKLKLGQRLINDYYLNKNSYFRIDCSEYKDDVIVIKTNISNFNFYASLTNPFPYYSDNNLLEIKNDAVVITKCKDGFVHFSLEPKADIRKEIIEVFSCESYQPDNKCKFVGDNKNAWIIFTIFVFAFVVFFLFYKCKYNLSRRFNRKNKKRLNVFDTIK